MITLGQFIQSQKPSLSKNPCGYKIIDITHLLNYKNSDKPLDDDDFFDTLYQSPESFPEELLNKYIYHFEPVKSKYTDDRLFLRIILL